MKLLTTTTAVRSFCSAHKQTIFVPTMGGLHEGHLALVRQARQLGDCVVVSIYVNPLQFGAGEDFTGYPRRLAEDCDKLQGLADVVYTPDDAEMYPETQTVKISLPPLADELCGKTRPGFFHGVAVVVCKLFNQVQPTTAIFGEKDFQQTRLIRLLTRQLAMPIDIVTHPTVRDTDGLALSSRNEYLTTIERQQAPQLYATLKQAAQAIAGGVSDYAKICQAATAAINDAGMMCDYFAVRDADDLSTPTENKAVVLLAAARLGKTRLIDNLTIRR